MLDGRAFFRNSARAARYASVACLIIGYSLDGLRNGGVR